MITAAWPSASLRDALPIMMASWLPGIRTFRPTLGPDRTEDGHPAPLKASPNHGIDLERLLPELGILAGRITTTSYSSAWAKGQRPRRYDENMSPTKDSPSMSELGDSIFFDSYTRALASNLNVILADGQADIVNTPEASEAVLSSPLEDIDAGP